MMLIILVLVGSTFIDIAYFPDEHFLVTQVSTTDFIEVVNEEMDCTDFGTSNNSYEFNKCQCSFNKNSHCNLVIMKEPFIMSIISNNRVSILYIDEEHIELTRRLFKNSFDLIKSLEVDIEFILYQIDHKYFTRERDLFLSQSLNRHKVLVRYYEMYVGK